MVEPVEIIHIPDHSYVKGPKGSRGCKAIKSNNVPCNLAHFHPFHNLPTLNETLTHDWSTYQGALKHWKRWLKDALVGSGLPRELAAVVVMMECTFPDKNRRDQDNMRGFIHKALGDTLASPWCFKCGGLEWKKRRCIECGSYDQLPGWIRDDTFYPINYFQFDECQGRYEKGVRRTSIMILPQTETLEIPPNDDTTRTLW